jgi:hypothetical protein
MRVPANREPAELERRPPTRAIADSLGGLAYPAGFAHPCELQEYSGGGWGFLWCAHLGTF